MLDLGERQPESARLANECEQAEHVGGITTVAGRLPARCLQNAARLIEPQRLATQAASRGDLTNQQAVPLHGESLKPAPWGKVKG
jgi:hypothetical protein